MPSSACIMATITLTVCVVCTYHMFVCMALCFNCVMCTVFHLYCKITLVCSLPHQCTLQSLECTEGTYVYLSVSMLHHLIHQQLPVLPGIYCTRCTLYVVNIRSSVTWEEVNQQHPFVGKYVVSNS